MDEQFAGSPSELAERGMRYTKDQFDEILQQTEDYVRQNPTKSMLYALAAGFLLNRLPIARLVGGVVRLALVAIKPAVLAYGATKVYQAAKPDEA